MSSDALADRLQDFYLFQFCYQKELEPFYRPLQNRLAKQRKTAPAAPVATPGAEASVEASPAPAKP